MTVITQCTYVALLGYLQKTFHDESLQGLLHYGYQVLYREVYHAALEPPEAILLMRTIYRKKQKTRLSPALVGDYK